MNRKRAVCFVLASALGMLDKARPCEKERRAQ